MDCYPKDLVMLSAQRSLQYIPMQPMNAFYKDWYKIIQEIMSMNTELVIEPLGKDLWIYGQNTQIGKYLKTDAC